MSDPAREPDAARERPRGAPAHEARTLPDGTPVTVVHVVRHGEVHNPDGVLYGQLPGYHLSERGRAMAQAAADSLAEQDITYVVASPLERAQETAAPIAAAHRLSVAVDDRLTESANHFQGLQVGRGEGALWRRRHWKAYTNPFTPSWGEPYAEIAARMTEALEVARARAEGHEAVMVSHQLPVWTLRRSLERTRLWHHPRRRECSLASVTSVTFHGTDPVGIDYAEPARHLLVGALDVTGASGRTIR
ncbi:histidine phosphatase family protein [Ornithinimicrobium avium]|uniref:Histidine phosphatase family protein n=1 Tax=Ornithinimicrobium avium TaxID=2283195 RepID=A0A345NQA8_9MICO|nr:histidine phosphatase family protein [Ornithinimicrobium avium]AXH97216.1 histidine phosphatase family protein [Ornithinimicrobium avium]